MNTFLALFALWLWLFGMLGILALTFEAGRMKGWRALLALVWFIIIPVLILSWVYDDLSRKARR